MLLHGAAGLAQSYSRYPTNICLAAHLNSPLFAALHKAFPSFASQRLPRVAAMCCGAAAAVVDGRGFPVKPPLAVERRTPPLLYVALRPSRCVCVRWPQYSTQRQSLRNLK